MKIFDKRAVLLCVTVLLLAFFSVFLYKTVNEKGDFESILLSIAQEKHIDPYLKQAVSSLQFMKNVLQPSPQSPEGQQLSKLHFQLAETLLAKNEQKYFNTALKQYEKAVLLFPSLNHGWPYFNMGVILEKTNRPDEAILQYRTVSHYDNGNLNLLAGYRIALIHNKETDKKVNSVDLYNYLRFSSKNVWNDIAPFDPKALDEGEVTEYLHALIACNSNNRANAISLLENYIVRNPKDYSAHYYLDLFQKNSFQSLYPGDGDLRVSCFAPKAIRNGSIILSHDMAVRCDLYIPQKEFRKIDIEIALENPYQIPFHCSLQMNNQVQNHEFNGQKVDSAVFRFSQFKNRNLLELRIHIPAEPLDKPSYTPRILRLTTFRIRIEPSENQP